MLQAAWNVCPVSSMTLEVNCYFAEDQTFANISGTISTVIDDCPNGNLLLYAESHNVLDYIAELGSDPPNRASIVSESMV